MLDNGDGVTMLAADTGLHVPTELMHVVASTVLDWEIVEATDTEAMVGTVLRRHRTLRAALNIEACLLGVSESLQYALLEDVESLLAVGISADGVKSHILVAPLQHPEGMAALVAKSLAKGFTATASVLEDIREMQALLSRACEHWLQIPEHQFGSISGGRKQLWILAAQNGIVRDTIRATKRQDIADSWTQLAFQESSPATRSAIARIGNALADGLFPSSATFQRTTSNSQPLQTDIDYESKPRRPALDRRGSKLALERALAQVSAITQAIAEGKDGRARKFLRELVIAQTEWREDDEHVLKSLCNIATQCADMFRTDFEFECLQTALQIQPYDGWTLIQLGDHYKRVGAYEKALHALEDADRHGQHRVALSSVADVYSQMGDSEKALQLYRSIPDSDNDSAIRTAIADVLRRSGRFAEATAEYERLISDGLASDRAISGLAQIARQEGRLDAAVISFKAILESTHLDSTSRAIYRLSLASVLKLRGDFHEAYQLLDQIIQERPFWMRARVLRAAVVGLLGNAEVAVSFLPQMGKSRAFDEWVYQYVRGLLLLKLERHNDAKLELIRELDTALVDQDAKAVLRLGAAVFFLRRREDIPNARRVLSDLQLPRDPFAGYVARCLEFHIAIAERDLRRCEQLESELVSAENATILDLVTAIKARDWKRASDLEVGLLLRMVA